MSILGDGDNDGGTGVGTRGDGVCAGSDVGAGIDGGVNTDVGAGVGVGVGVGVGACLVDATVDADVDAGIDAGVDAENEGVDADGGIVFLRCRIVRLVSARDKMLARIILRESRHRVSDKGFRTTGKH